MSQMILVDKCCDCGKKIHTGYSVRTKNGFEQIPRNYKTFNQGKIKRCLECCAKQGITEILIKERDIKF